MPGGGSILDVIGAILGGAGGMGGQQQAPVPQGGGGIGDILGGILGGGGGAGSGIGASPIMAPIINAISRKLGLPPFLVSIGLSLLLGKLMSKATQATRQPQAPQTPRGNAGQSGGGALNIDDILNQIKGGKVDRGQLEQSGVIEDIAKETGLDKNAAGSMAEEILRELGAEGSARPKPRQSGRGSTGPLKDLLNTW